MKAFFLHYEVVPATPTEEVQGGTAEVCCLAEDVQAADVLARNLILSQRFLPGPAQAARQHALGQTRGLDAIESTLLEKARQRTPPAALMLTAWGAPREHAEVRPLPIPADGSKH
ncbi:hypothetical protein [Luteimonas sp. FCS-9]|uniref:hypothetical protein n=1 Tax=Luteimonas sp. FCS-9 TaxID=1547516 RepID=UPI0012E039A0|nr:hypothetical protein [Luteimonas sp. FCS-9]